MSTRQTTTASMSAARLALLARQARRDGLDTALREPIAIIGMGCRLPGGADDPERFWALLQQGYDAVSDVPAERWSVEEWFDPDPATAGKTSVKAGAFLADVAGFDTEFFGIPKREADRMDPHQRLALEVAWEALEDAGLPLAAITEKSVGVFVASYNNDYVLHQYLRPDAINERTITGVVHSVVANRISHFLGLHGPSLAIDTACSSSLVAVHLACRSLREEACDVAFAGGVSLMLRPEPFVALSKAGFMALDGRCKTFDASADGFGRGEGCGFVILRRLSDALSAGNRIDAVIRGSAVNQDGHSTVLAAPNGRSQVRVVLAALEDAQVSAQAVSYVEAHGTGTRLGDPIEVEALAEALGPPPAGPRWLASVKANIGHLEAAAGIAGLIKVVLSLRHRSIAPHIHLREENPLLHLRDHGFTVPASSQPWVAAEQQRIAAVSSFGIGGTNAHVILEEAPPTPTPAPEASHGPWLLPLAARGGAARKALALRYADFLDRLDDRSETARRVCASAASRRTPLGERIAVVGSTSEELARKLREWATDPNAARIRAGSGDPDNPPRPVFVFSGQGSQWAGMGRSLASEEPAFLSKLEEIDRLFAPLAGWSLLAALRGETVPYTIDDTFAAQPLIFAIQVGLAHVLERWGILPHVVIGHSVGELAAAHVAGHLTLAEAVEMVFHRGRVMQHAPDDGAMLAARLTAEEAADLLDRQTGAVSLGAANGPRSVVFSGQRDAIRALAQELAGRGVQARELTVRYGFHSAQMAPFEDELRSVLRNPNPGAARSLFVSTVTGEMLPLGGFDAAYVARNVVSPVRFHTALRSALAAGGDVIVELAPRPVLGANILEAVEAGGQAVQSLSTLSATEPGRAGILATAASLYCLGARLRWEEILGVAPVDVELPSYAWQHERCWLDADERRSVRGAHPGRTEENPFVGRRLDVPTLPGVVFDRRLRSDADHLSDHRIGGHCLVPAVMMLEMARAAAAAVEGVPISVVDGQFLRPVPLSDSPRELQLALRTADGGREIELHTRPDDGEWAVVFKAAIALQPPPHTIASRQVDEIAARCPALVAPDDFYRTASEAGYDFGPSFRRIEALRVGAGEALARLAPMEGNLSNHLPPALFDAALQPALALLRADAGLHVPTAIGSYRRLEPGLPRWSWIRETQPDERSQRRFDVELLDENGRILAAVEGLTLTAVPSGFTDLADPRSAVFGVRWREAEAAAEQAAAADGVSSIERYVVLADHGGFGAALAARLTTSGVRVDLVPSSDAAAEDSEWGRCLEAARGSDHPVGWIHCGALDAPVALDDDAPAFLNYQRDLCRPVLDIVRTFRPGRPDHLVLLTRGAHAADGVAPPNQPWGAALVGLCRAIRREHPEVHCRAIDLETASEPEIEQVRALLDRLERTEPVLALRRGLGFVPRLTRLEPHHAQPSIVERSGNEVAATRVVHLAVPGDLTSLETRTVARGSPGADEVEIEVRWAALNFRDVMAGLGLVPSRVAHGLGHECAGVVTRVGTEVRDVRAGDEVLALAEGAFGDHVICRSRRVFPKPTGLGWPDAATLPIAYLTAYHVLDRIAAVRTGQRVLVHCGAGGVGQAAVRLALRRGAVVFATAGSPEKRALLETLGLPLVMDSRSTAFANQLLEHTAGEGVDVVVNSLAGDAIDAGLSLLRKGGVFIELGKRTVRSPEAVERAFPGVRYVAFDLFDELDEEPEPYHLAFADLLSDLAGGRLMPLPYQVFARRDMTSAFRLMARGGHIGKILLRFSRPAIVTRSVHANATYLVTGGTGEVGLASAAWLVRRGARSLVLASRTEPGEKAIREIQRLRAAGAAIEWARLDVEDLTAVRALVGRLATAERPLRGVVHAAGVVDDALLRDLDGERLLLPFRPKVLGAWNLARSLDPTSLDFLILYSAAGSFLDPAGQANYAAANSLVDALAGYLQGEGYPAMSIAWGLWEGGMAERISAAHRTRWETLGLRPINAATAGAMLDEILGTAQAQVAALLIDWGRYLRGIDGVDPMFRALEGAFPERSAETVRSLPDLWRPLPPQRLRAALREHILERLARVLGRTTPEIEPDRPFRDLGLDSLMAVELRNALTRDLGHPLSATLAFDYPDLDSVTDHLVKLLFPRTVETEGRTTTRETATPHHQEDIDPELLALSEAEAERLLLEELADGATDAMGRGIP